MAENENASLQSVKFVGQPVSTQSPTNQIVRDRNAHEAGHETKASEWGSGLHRVDILEEVFFP